MTFSPLRIIENGQVLLNQKKQQDKAKAEEAKVAAKAVKKGSQANGVEDAAPSAPSKSGGGEAAASEPKIVVIEPAYQLQEEETSASVSIETVY